MERFFFLGLMICLVERKHQGKEKDYKKEKRKRKKKIFLFDLLWKIKKKMKYN